MKAILDTTILIDMLKREEKAVQKVEELRKNATLYTTAVNVYEVWRGIKRLKSNQERYADGLKMLINNIYVLPFNIEAAEKSADIYAELSNRGINIDEGDYMIGGCALSNGIEMLVTRNEKHFKQIKELKVITY